MTEGDQDLDLEIEKDETYNDYEDSKQHLFINFNLKSVLDGSTNNQVHYLFALEQYARNAKRITKVFRVLIATDNWFL